MYEYHYDGGHGWLKVPMSEIEELGDKVDITSYSYRKDGYAYLEEDWDATQFMVAKGITMQEVTSVDDGDDSIIRTYPRF
jgi:hypothetical protein